jgi:RNA polymerase sigma-70 factor, ECF subfamily
MERVDDEAELVAALRRGDEAAFMELVERYHQSLVRLAMAYVGSRASAEDVAQETWLGVLQSIPRFEGRSSLKTWIFRILTNRAKTRALREGRSLPFSAVQGDDEAADGPTVDADRFFPAGHAEAGWWVSYPSNWESIPEQRLLAEETRAQVAEAIDALPPNQRTVITLRDVEGLSAEEVAQMLAVSPGNQRVLLHRARASVRRRLEAYLSEQSEGAA